MSGDKQVPQTNNINSVDELSEVIFLPGRTKFVACYIIDLSYDPLRLVLLFLSVILAVPVLVPEICMFTLSESPQNYSNSYFIFYLECGLKS